MHKTIYSLLLLLMTFPLLAQVTPEAAIDSMGRGINLGNSLEAPTQTAWGNPLTREEHFDAYVEAGFTNVRVPVKWDRHTGTTPPYTISASWLNRVEEIVDWGLERGLWITLNTHHDDWIKQNYSQANRDRFDAIWRQISARFKDKSHRLLYEMINEPKGLSITQVNDLNKRVLGIIRENEPTRLVIFGGNMYANAEQLVQTAVPDADDDYLIGYYHSYDPWPFAGEHRGTWGTAADYRNMANKFNTAKGWSNRRGIPVHVSEFNARVEADFNSRMRWLAEYVGLADQHGFAFSAWDDGGWFKVMNRSNASWPETKDIFIHYHQDSPNQFALTNVNNGVRLSWNNRADDTGEIIIERRLSPTTTSSTRPFTEVGRAASDATEYVDASTTAGTTYDWRIRTSRTDGTPVYAYPQRLRATNTGDGNSGGNGGGMSQSPFGNTNAIPGTVEIEDYDNGGEGVAYHDNDAANQGGAYRTDEGVDIGGGPNGGFVLGYVGQGEWLEYTVEVAESGVYSVTTSAASALAASDFTISFGDEAETSFNTPNTGDWNAYRTIDANGDLTLTAGTHVLRLDITGEGAFNLDNLIFTLKSTATEEESVRAGFTVTPNPASDVVRVELPADLHPARTNLMVISMTGRIVRTELGFGSGQTVSLGTLPAGTYVLRATDGERNYLRRIVKQ